MRGFGNMKSFGAAKVDEAKKARSIDQVVEDLNKPVDEALAKKRAHEKDVQDTLDGGFYFAVVFRTRKERDDFTAQMGVELIDDEYVWGDQLLVDTSTESDS
jgi:hypothetical protein